MNRRLKKHLEEQGATPVDSEVLEEYRAEMDRVMPKISETYKAPGVGCGGTAGRGEQNVAAAEGGGLVSRLHCGA